MDAAKEAQIKAHALALAELLYDETDPDQVKTLAGIEAAVGSSPGLSWGWSRRHLEPVFADRAPKRAG